MTQKLYDADSYATEFEGQVMSCRKCERGYETVLDRTLFFPEEGGQCCDRGTLDGINVTYVRIEGDDIYHYTDLPLEEGSLVKGAIDPVLRMRNMQNHTGEHIICGIAHKMYGYENVGFHLGEDCVTMDLDGPLTSEQITEIEGLANEAIYRNVSVTAVYPSEEELASISYRSKSEIKGKIRIVTIEDYDICACCAPHVARTGEIGIIKVTDFFPHRGGVRLTIVCGSDALADYRNRFAHTLAVSNLLSVKQSEVTEGVTKLLEDMGKLRHEISERGKKIARIYADTVVNTDGNVCIFDSDLDRDAMRIIANEVMAKKNGVIGVFSGDDAKGYNYYLGSSDVNLKSVVQRFNAELSGRGGGSETMVQGSVKACEADIRDFVKNL